MFGKIIICILAYVLIGIAAHVAFYFCRKDIGIEVFEEDDDKDIKFICKYGDILYWPIYAIGMLVFYGIEALIIAYENNQDPKKKK